ncbi:hypothetical protein [Cytobacillus kochii]|uniref:hypothetical protein n=1 Tax=Cytobacillus kochii TaxID=859143 RepID=UPI00203C9703|nr:hypothetical protein [Cytobacillus kochii]MCM3323288.1 hypothetical protein [Cytobacillus kochii]MCM3345683.1 hypothetical protein [Cytobacillus kochii]
MNKRQAIGYYLLASKESGLPRQVIKQILDEFDTVFKKYSEEEAEELGIEIQLELDAGEYGPFGKQIQEAMYEERLNTYERLYQIRERDPDAVKALEIFSICLPIRKVDHERLREKYSGIKEGEVDEK